MEGNMWRVAAGRQGRFIRQFLNANSVSIGWRELGDLTAYPSKDAMMDEARRQYPGWSDRKLQVAVGQSWRFVHGLAKGDRVVSYDPAERVYHLGTILGAATYNAAVEEEEYEVARPVEWTGRIARDTLSITTRNSLGAIQTLIKVPDLAAAEMLGERAGVADPAVLAELTQLDEVAEIDPYAELFEKSVQRVQDLIVQLDPYEMQDLVAALLRSLGYRTLVSPAGADRGKDIIASRDGFGFERPRIVVEVKHRRGKIGAPDVRAFIGGRHVDDRGLYVSTGGFSQDALYEAERSTTVTHLMDLDALARAVLENYDSFDEPGRSLLRLRRLYWPAGE